MKTRPLLLASSLLVLLTACSTMPTAPGVLVLPGGGKNFEDFRRDDVQCRQFAAQQIGSAPGSANAQGGSYGWQRQYDNAFVQCMYASGHVVPVPGDVARGRTVVPTEPAPGNYPPPPGNPPPAGNPPAAGNPPPPPPPPPR